MPNGEGLQKDFEKKLAEWEEKNQLYVEQTQVSQQQITDLSKHIEAVSSEEELQAKIRGERIPSWMLPSWELEKITPPLQKAIVAQAKPLIAQAVIDLERNDFYARLYGEVPFAISAGQVSSPDEVLTLLAPPDTLTADELAEVQNTILDMITTITRTPEAELPEGVEYPELVAPVPVTRVPITIHQLSTQEIIKSLTIPRPPESAMSEAEWEEFLRMKGYTDEDIDMEQQILAEGLIDSWADRNNQLAAFKSSVAEMPDYKLTDLLKEMAVQPGLALAEIGMKYFEHVSMPLAGTIYKTFIPDLEAEYQRFKVANPDVSEREALVHAWRAWDAPFDGAAQWILKYMLMEGLVDPLTYVGWGIATKLTKPIPYVGRLVGALEGGALALFEIPFDVIKGGLGRIPKTLTQRAVLAQHQASQYVERYLTKVTGRHLRHINMKDFTGAVDRAIKYTLKNTQVEDDIALAGREMLKHAPVDEAITRDWAARLGATLRAEDITRVTVENIENLFEDMFMRKLITPREAAGQLLKVLHISISDDAIKLAQRILETRAATILRGAAAFTRAKTPLAAMRALATKNFRTHILIEESAAALARKEAGAFSVLLHNVDLRLQGIWRNGIDRWVVRPFAESYLTFGMYGPMNIVEDYFRSALGGVRPRRMTDEAWSELSMGLLTDPELHRYGMSEMIGALAREAPKENWNNWILQIFALGQKRWADKIYSGLVRLPGAYGMDVRRNFIARRYIQILADAGGDQFQALARVGPKLPKLADRKLIRELDAVVYRLKTTGSPDIIKGGKDLFTRRRIIRNEVNNILKEHPNLPNTARDHIIKSFDDDIIFREAGESIERTIAETRNIVLDDFIRGPEVATQQYHQLADFLTALEVRNPQEMASAIQAVYKMSEIYGALPDQIIAQATIRSRGLPLAERRATFDADFDRIYMFLDNAGADIDKVIAKIRLDVPKLAEANYQDAATRLFDIMMAKREFATEFRAQNMATRSEIFRGISKKEMTGDFWDNFYLQMNNEYRIFNLRMAELDGQLVKSIESMNIAAGAKITPRAPIIVRDRPLAPQDIATLLGVRGDDISRSLLDVITVQNNKDFFITYVQGMTRPGDIGFTKEAIGAVYDQISYSLRVSPESMSWISGKQMDLDAVRKELHSLYNSKMLPDDEIAAIGKYFDDMADAVDRLMFEPGIVAPQAIIDAELARYPKDIRAKIASIREAKGVTDVSTDVAGNIRLDYTDIESLPSQLAHEVGHVHYKSVETEFNYFMRGGKVHPSRLSELYAEAFEEFVTSKPMDLSRVPASVRGYAMRKEHPEFVDLALDFIRGEKLRLGKPSPPTPPGKAIGEIISGAEWREMPIPLNRDITLYKATVVRPADTGVQLLGKGTYTAPTYQGASRWGKGVVGVRARIKKALLVDPETPDLIVRSDINRGLRRIGHPNPEALSVDEVHSWLRRNGYDAIIGKVEHRGFDDVLIINKDAIIEYGVKVTPPTLPTRALKSEYANFDDLRQSAMDEAHKWYYKEYPDYTNANAFDALMKTIYPYWTYESQRWFWLPRAFVRHPGLFTTFERWQNNTDYGYVHIPGTSVDINPFRGTIFGTLTTRLTRRDFPEYYDSLGALSGLVEFNDFLSRFGFYPGAHIGIPLAILGGLEQQMGETMPAIWKTPLNALITTFPESESVKWLSDHLFSDRFRDYMTILEVNKRGYNGSHIWTKIKERIELTPEEQAIWDESRQEAAFYGMFFEQFGLFRLRTDEQYKAYKESSKVIEEMTGYNPDQQDWLRRHGYRIWDIVGGLSPTNQAILQELESFKWLGTVTPLLPSRQQEELRKLDLDWDAVTQYSEGMQAKKLQLQQEFLSGILGPREYNDRLQALYSEQRTYIDKKMEENPNMTLEGRKDYYKKYGIIIPVQHPMRELLNLYFSIELEDKYDEDTGELMVDWDTFFAQRNAIEDAIPEELKGEWDAYLSRNTTRIEEVRRDVSSKYFRKYYDVWEATLAAYPEGEQKLINEFLYLERTGQQLARQGEIRVMISTKTDNQLISSFRSEVSDNRASLRYANPHLDAWLFFWGRVTSFKTPQAETIYYQICRSAGRKI